MLPKNATLRSSLLRLWGLKQVLSLPTAVLRFVSGGGVVYHDGRTLDPQLQFLWRSYLASNEKVPLSLTAQPLEQVRQDWSDLVTLLGVPAQAKVKTEQVSSETVRGLLIRPTAVSADAPLLVFFHQGGGVLGGPDLSKAFCAILAHEARCPVFLPEYRLAPLNRFPAACDDARLAFEWAQANAMRLGARTGEIAIGGILTGAALSARLCLDLRRDFKPLPVAQLLVTPLLDFSDPQLKAGNANGVWPLTAGDVETMIGHYAGASDLSDPRLSPAREKLIVGQPRTLIASAGLDPLATQAEAFARRLIEARTRVVYRRYDTLPLGFDLFPGIVDAAFQATQDIARLWVDMLRAGHAEAGKADLPDVA